MGIWYPAKICSINVSEYLQVQMATKLFVKWFGEDNYSLHMKIRLMMPEQEDPKSFAAHLVQY